MHEGAIYREGFKNRNMARLQTLEKARGFELFLRGAALNLSQALPAPGPGSTKTHRLWGGPLQLNLTSLVLRTLAKERGFALLQGKPGWTQIQWLSDAATGVPKNASFLGWGAARTDFSITSGMPARDSGISQKEIDPSCRGNFVFQLLLHNNLSFGFICL